ncbi:MAG: DUF4398 domain-containing protein [Myxococcota bacterium]
MNVRTMTRTCSRALFVLVAGGALMACASTQVSTEEMTGPSSAISTAEEAGAREVPEASYHLKLAEEQYARAQELVDEDEGERAKRFLERAQVDARLAHQIARLEATRTRATQAVQQVQDLRRELPSETKPFPGEER